MVETFILSKKLGKSLVLPENVFDKSKLKLSKNSKNIQMLIKLNSFNSKIKDIIKSHRLNSGILLCL